MTKTSATFGKDRDVTELESPVEVALWLASLEATFRDAGPEEEALKHKNTGGMFRLSWLCPRCENEHRLEAPWVQVITAQQQILSMGMAVATSLAPAENARHLDNLRVCEALDGFELTEEDAEAVTSRLADILSKPKGNA